MLSLTLFIPDVRPEIIPMLPAHLGEKNGYGKIVYMVCVKFDFLSNYITYIQVLYIK